MVQVQNIDYVDTPTLHEQMVQLEESTAQPGHVWCSLGAMYHDPGVRPFVVV